MFIRTDMIFSEIRKNTDLKRNSRLLACNLAHRLCADQSATSHAGIRIELVSAILRL